MNRSERRVEVAADREAPLLTPGQSLARGLEVIGLAVSYGGNKAVDQVSLDAPIGRITGLIGPNGAGKTTIFNAASGLLRPSAGTIRLFGDDVSHRGSAARARLGLGRTFQLMQLVNTMTVERNVAMAAECRIAARNPLRQLFATPVERRAIREGTKAALARCGIEDVGPRLVGTLSTGQRRLVELARTLAGNYRLLLLDEPSSGLDEEETEAFGDILRQVVAEEGVGILLVEHDMGLVMTVCHHIHVLDFGKLIYRGSPLEVQASDLVRAAYLGEEGAMA